MTLENALGGGAQAQLHEHHGPDDQYDQDRQRLGQQLAHLRIKSIARFAQQPGNPEEKQPEQRPKHHGQGNHYDPLEQFYAEKRIPGRYALFEIFDPFRITEMLIKPGHLGHAGIGNLPDELPRLVARNPL